MQKNKKDLDWDHFYRFDMMHFDQIVNLASLSVNRLFSSMGFVACIMINSNKYITLDSNKLLLGTQMAS